MTEEFDSQKRKFFQELVMTDIAVFKVHPKELWERVERDGKTVWDWRNVSEHCLVVKARTLVLAKMLGLSEKMARKLGTAAVLHDIGKKGQKKLVAKREFTYEAFDVAAKNLENQLRKLVSDNKIIEIAGSCGHEAILGTILPILEKPVKEMTEFDWAKLIIFYVDGYTKDTEWTTPAETVDGIVINEVDRRTLMNMENQRYRAMNIPRAEWGGKSPYQVQNEVTKKIEVLLTERANKHLKLSVNPLDLPTEVDDRIKSRIMAI